MIEVWRKGRLIGAAVLIAGCATISPWNQFAFLNWPQPGGAAPTASDPADAAQIDPLLEVQHVIGARARKLPEVHLTTPLRLLL